MTTVEFDGSDGGVGSDGREAQEVLDAVHRFSVEVMRPVGSALDKMANPESVVAPGSPLWEVFARYDELGLDELTGIRSQLAPHEQARLRAIVSEELGWGDSGLAISLGVSGFPRVLAEISGNAEMIERFGGPGVIGCWPITEPDHGSDQLTYAGQVHRMPARPNCIARRDGGDYVIDGQKAAWVSNGTIATAAALFCAVEAENGGIGGLGAFVVPLDLPGVKRGAPLDKLGQRALNQGEIFFEHVRVPGSYLVLPPEPGTLTTDMVLSSANAGMGATFVGVARAALEMAVDYSKERVQGGVPIFEHQSVRSRLFRMYRLTQSARALARHTLLVNAVNERPSLPLAVASKVTATETAFEVASMALQIHGANGLARACPVEKLLRDARASMIEDGCNEVLGIIAAGRL